MLRRGAGDPARQPVELRQYGVAPLFEVSDHRLDVRLARVCVDDDPFRFLRGSVALLLELGVGLGPRLGVVGVGLARTVRA